MKIKLLCRKEMREQIITAIQKQDIQFADDGEFVLYEVNHQANYLLVKDQDDYIRLAVEDIIYIESVSQEIIVHTMDGTYKS